MGSRIEKEGRAAITLRKTRWLLRMTYSSIADFPIADLTPQEVLAVLRKVETKGHYESATRIRSILSRVFRYARC